VKILVVDDEPLARERLLRLLRRVQPDAELFQAADGYQAIASVEKHTPELLLLDIKMPGRDGLEVAAILARMESPPAVVFCTAYDEYALEALQQHAAAYLLKPVRETELHTALENAGRLNRLQLEALQHPGKTENQTRQIISSHSHGRLETLHIQDIRCFLAHDKYVTAITPEAELLIHQSLKELEKELGEQFLRIHRNALVAKRHIQRLEKFAEDGWHVVLHDIEHKPAISRRHLKEVKSLVSQAC
jgi:two-component system, LytTR family, response regulator AlgR